MRQKHLGEGRPRGNALRSILAVPGQENRPSSFELETSIDFERRAICNASFPANRAGGELRAAVWPRKEPLVLNL
jgi:hypothetical protein